MQIRPFKSRLWVLCVVMLLALAVRLPDLGWGLPDIEEEAFPAKVAMDMWGFDDGSPNLDPGTAGWPALSFYVQWGLQHLDYLAGRATGRFGDPLDYDVAWRLDPGRVILIGRAASVLCFLVVVWVAILLATRFGAEPAAWTAGLLCALSPLMVSHSQRVEPDALVVALSALALFWIVRLAETGRLRHYLLAAVCIGLGTAAKYTPILLALSLYALHLERRRSEGLSLRWAGLDDRRLGWAALTSFLVFCLSSPWTLANLDVLRRDFSYQALHMSSGHFGQDRQGPGYLFYLLRVLPDALGWPALLTGLAGLGLGWRAGGSRRALIWGFLPFFGVLGGMSTHFERYMLPAALPLAVGAGLSLSWLRGRIPGIRGRAAVLVALMILLAAPVMGTADYHRVQSRPGTRRLATEWLEAHASRETDTVATERYGPELQRDERESLKADPAFLRMNELQQSRLLDRPVWMVLDIPMYSVRTDLTAYYYDLRHYMGYDWLVTSGSVRNRYLSSPDEFPVQNRFYSLLDSLTEPAWSIRPEGELRGPAIEIYSIDDNLRERVFQTLGPLAPDHFRAWGNRVHALHFFNFVETVAAHAEATGRLDYAAFYYEVLGMAGNTDALRAHGVEKAALIRLRNRQLDQAERLFRILERSPERRLVAIGNLGLIAEQNGNPAEARERYETVIREDPGGQAGRWARNRLAQLRATREKTGISGKN